MSNVKCVKWTRDISRYALQQIARTKRGRTRLQRREAIPTKVIHAATLSNVSFRPLQNMWSSCLWWMNLGISRWYVRICSHVSYTHIHIYIPGWLLAYVGIVLCCAVSWANFSLLSQAMAMAMVKRWHVAMRLGFNACPTCAVSASTINYYYITI